MEISINFGSSDGSRKTQTQFWLMARNVSYRDYDYVFQHSQWKLSNFIDKNRIVAIFIKSSLFETEINLIKMREKKTKVRGEKYAGYEKCTDEVMNLHRTSKTFASLFNWDNAKTFKPNQLKILFLSLSLTLGCTSQKSTNFIFMVISFYCIHLLCLPWAISVKWTQFFKFSDIAEEGKKKAESILIICSLNHQYQKPALTYSAQVHDGCAEAKDERKSQFRNWGKEYQNFLLNLYESSSINFTAWCFQLFEFVVTLWKYLRSKKKK